LFRILNIIGVLSVGWGFEISGRNLFNVLQRLSFPLSIALLNSEPTSVINTTPAPICYFATGFLIDKSHYMSIAESLQSRKLCSTPVKFIDDSNGLDGKESIQSSAEKLLGIINQDATDANRPVMLLGHSRGGAVASYAATKLIDSSNDAREDMNTLKMHSKEKRINVDSLILFDPVDDADLTTLKFIESKTVPFPPTFIVSTPYGGKSKYYKDTVFASSCAPPSRSSKLFYSIIQTVAENQEKGELHKQLKQHIRLNEYKDLGHLQLLDDTEVLFSGSPGVCSSNDEVKGKQIDERKIEIMDQIEKFLSGSK